MGELWGEIAGMKTVLVTEIINLRQLNPSVNLVVESVQQRGELLD